MCLCMRDNKDEQQVSNELVRLQIYIANGS